MSFVMYYFSLSGSIVDYIKESWQNTFKIHPFGTHNFLCDFVGSIKTVQHNTHWHALVNRQMQHSLIEWQHNAV